MAFTEGVRAVRDAWSSHEIWIYECGCCGTSWDEEFDVRHTADGHGGEAVVYEHDGCRCMTPWLDHPCRECSSGNVKAFAAPWRRRAAVPPVAKEDALELVFRLRRLHAW
ncbi:hypothetical protein [Actinomadura hibisca]|uniref:hypothetical protein n=1 Tax=Actinomadura hibisca TaxID=68565 RepID=UPI00082CEDD0|nr:hypothetical protein [Actinomadura hibisca]